MRTRCPTNHGMPSSNPETTVKRRGGGTLRNMFRALLSTKAILPEASRTAFQKLAWNALLVFNIRAAVALLLRMLTVLRAQPRNFFDLKTLVGEESLRFRLEAVRLGLFVGGFSGFYTFLRAILSHWSAKFRQLCTFDAVKRDGIQSDDDLEVLVPPLDKALRPPVPTWVTFTSAGLAGLSFVLLGKDGGNRSIALYTGARALECSLKLLCHFNVMSITTVADSPAGYAAALYVFFALGTAQVMYAYVMRPETLPASYWNFIVKMGCVMLEVSVFH